MKSLNQLNMMYSKKYLFLAVTGLLFACSNAKQPNDKADNHTIQKPTESKAVNVVFKDEKLTAVYTDYLKLKDALVATKYEDAKNAANVLSKTLENSAIMGALLASSTKIANSKNIAEQRKEFTKLSNDMIVFVKKSDLASGSLFIQHCPMANEGEGGDWLAAEKKIQNPYYGSEMMECGAVMEEIKPTK